jgi:hypothetical protein
MWNIRCHAVTILPVLYDLSTRHSGTIRRSAVKSRESYSAQDLRPVPMSLGPRSPKFAGESLRGSPSTGPLERRIWAAGTPCHGYTAFAFFLVLIFTPLSSARHNHTYVLGQYRLEGHPEIAYR